MTISNITSLPAAPSRADPTNFSAKGDALMTALVNTFVPQMNTTITAINAAQSATDTSASTATAAATNANSAAATAYASANAAPWASGATYQLNNCAISQINFQTYRKKTTATANSGGATDPANDSTNWTLVGSTGMPKSARTANTALVTADLGKLIDITSGTFSQTFSNASALGSGWYCLIRNSGTGYITLAPAQTIDGLASVVMNPGEVRFVQCDGSVFTSVLINTEGYLYVREEQASGVVPSNTGSGAVTVVRVLNTTKANTMNASLASNIITLQPGTYRCRLKAPANGCNGHKAMLYNETDSVVIMPGSSEHSSSGIANAPPTSSMVVGQFTLTSQKNVSVRHYVASAAGWGFTAGAAGIVEVYTEAEFWKIA